MALRRLGLASGVVPELTPPQTVSAAAAGGFDMVGLWVEPADWTPRTTRDVQHRLADNGLTVIDVEVIWLKPGPFDPDHLRILDVGMAVSASNALVVSSDPDMDATASKFRALCEHVGDSGLRVALEFGLFTDIKSIGAANAILDDVRHPASALLVDALHLDRSGGSVDDVARVAPERLSYFQFCDALESRPDPADADAILDEAVFGRKQVGEGGLDLAGLLKALPESLPLSVELRSRQLYDAYPDCHERARVTADITRAFLRRVEGMPGAA